MSKQSLRVYFVRHDNGLRTGILMRAWDSFLDRPAPTAVGTTEEGVLTQLEDKLRAAVNTGQDTLSRYLWDETFETRVVVVEVHPQTAIKKRHVIGKRSTPIRLSYAWSKLPSGGYRVLLPRFGGRLILEDLSLAPEVLRNLLSTLLLGESPRWIYDFRAGTDEYVRVWEPRLLSVEDYDDAYDESTSTPVLNSVADELVAKAERRKLGITIGDSYELDALTPQLRRTPPPSLLLVGPSGIGKSTFVRRLARLLSVWKREARGREVRIARLWSTDTDRLLAGMMYLGMWQERISRLMIELDSEGDYLYLDRLTPLLRPQPDGGSIAEMMLPYIVSQRVSIIAECTEAEFEKCQRRFAALASACQVVRFTEPSLADTIKLTQQYQTRKAPHVTITPPAVKTLLRYLSSFQRSISFPGKAVRFVDWLAQEIPSDQAKTLFPSDMAGAFSRYSGLPTELIDDGINAPAEKHAASLQAAVIGQDNACLSCGQVLARFKAGLHDPDRPVGSMLFVGPTGVGKTELAKQLTRYVFGNENRMIRIDMSEYMFPGSSHRLLDVSAGTRSLAEQVRKEPLSLILFDEVEKAHPEVFDVLLGILGEGRLTDSLGTLVDFRMTLVVMTSNLGASGPAELGFDRDRAPDYSRAVRKHFRPEFFNRIDRVISFRALSRDDVLRIVDLELIAAASRTGMKRRNLGLNVTPDARQWLAQQGYDPDLGARPLRRVIEERVVAPIAALISQSPELRDRVLTVCCTGSAAADALPETDREWAVMLPKG